jgi:hypothetical protein
MLNLGPSILWLFINMILALLCDFGWIWMCSTNEYLKWDDADGEEWCSMPIILFVSYCCSLCLISAACWLCS